MYTYVQVALKIAHRNGVLSYRLKKCAIEPLVGMRVRVPLKNRVMTGVIIGEDGLATDDIKFKDVLEMIDDKPVITQAQLDLMNFCARYYFNDLGPCVHLALPKNEKLTKTLKHPAPPKATPLDLTPDQDQALQIILGQAPSAFLLEGVTGSGKTFVYIETARTLLAQNKSVLFLVPEISLTPQLVSRVQNALGIHALTMHSNITPAKKRDTIMALLNDQPQVLIGARSAIFMPLKNLGLIVVDEEHDASFKQDESPRYHARDLALWRARHEGAIAILGSATPSLESVYNAQNHKLQRIALPERFGASRSLPKVTVIDLKKRHQDVDHRTQDKSLSEGQKMCILSRPLVDEMRRVLAAKSQVLLFLNQRGYAKFGVCNACGKLVSCPNCSVSLTYYKNRNRLLCHQCTHTESPKTECGPCGQPSIKYLGLGTERLQEEVCTLFPNKTVLRLDRDVVTSQKRLEDVLNAMHENRADILIGTQMIAKGHDFQNVGLVGVVCADVALSMPDFRAAEKTFQLLTQVAGRAGRSKNDGQAFIQTFDPNHPSIHFAKTHNVRDFHTLELKTRQMFGQPPFVRTALIKSEHKDQAVAKESIEYAYQLLKSHGHLTILGPAPSAMERLHDRFRFQCLVSTKDAATLHSALLRLKTDAHLQGAISAKKLRFIIDVDPQNLT